MCAHPAAAAAVACHIYGAAVVYMAPVFPFPFRLCNGENGFPTFGANLARVQPVERLVRGSRCSRRPLARDLEPLVGGPVLVIYHGRTSRNAASGRQSRELVLEAA